MHPLDLAPFLPRFGASLAAGLLTTWAAISIGALVLRRFGFVAPSGLFWPLAGAVGYAAMGCAVALLAVAHLAFTPAIALVPFALVVVSWRSALIDVPRSFAESSVRVSAAPLLDRLLIGCALAAIATSAIAAALPAVWWDPLAYHLPIVAQTLRTHALPFDPALTQSAFPLLGECAALPAYALAGSSGAAMATLGAGTILAWLCGGLALRFAKRTHAITIALVACSAVWLWLAPSFYVDIPYALFAVGALAIPLAAEAAPNSVALFAGVLAGSAAAVKYPGVVLGPIVLAVVLLAFRERRWQLAGIFASAFIAIAGGWYLRGELVAGDALYPFGTALWGATGTVHDFARRYVDMTANWCGGGSSPLDFVLLPWRMLVDPRQYCGDPGLALRLGVVLFAASIAVWRVAWRPAVLTIVLTVVWFSGSRQDRFLIPALCFFAITIAVALCSLPLRDVIRSGATIALGALCAVGVAASWLPSLETISSNSLVPSLPFIEGVESANDLLSQRLESYDAMAWLRARLKPGEQVLAIDDVRDYYLGERAAWANPYYQPVWHVDWSAAPQQRYRAFAAAGFRYAIVDLNPAYLQRTPTGLDEVVLERDVAAGVVREIFATNDVIVLALPEPGR